MMPIPKFVIVAASACAVVLSGPVQAAAPTAAERNVAASEQPCPAAQQAKRAGGLVDIAPDGTGSTARVRDCVVLGGTRGAAQIGRSIEVSDGARGPASGPSIATAASGSYALSLVNTRPRWTTTDLTGEADGLSIFVRQARGDTAAMLANVAVRSGFAATLESYTFSADAAGQPVRGVRTQMGVVNSRDGGEYGLVLQAENGSNLSAGLRIASLGAATWTNYLEAINGAGETVAIIRGKDGAFVGGDVLPVADRRNRLGSPDRIYAATYTQLLQLSTASFAQLPRCGGGVGGGTLAFVNDARRSASDRIRVAGGGKEQTFVKCDGTAWTAF